MRARSECRWQLEEQFYPIAYKMKNILFSDIYWRLYSKYRHHCHHYTLHREEAADIAQYSIKNLQRTSYTHTTINATLHVRGSSHCSLQAITSDMHTPMLQHGNVL
jgi:hypothetical protein